MRRLYQLNGIHQLPISNETSATAYLSPAVVGSYTVQLVVNDGIVESTPDMAVIVVDVE